MSDEFFDDELELMEADAGDAGASAAEVADTTASAAPVTEDEAAFAAEAAASVPAATDRTAGELEADDAETPGSADKSAVRRDAPPFWMVLAIATIALILGVVIGYMLGTSATLAELGGASAQASQTSEDASSQLPQGHPDLDISEDGTATVAGSGTAE